MKRIAALLLAILCLCALAGCGQSMNDIIADSPCIIGVVEEVEDGFIYIRTNAVESPAHSSGLYRAATTGLTKDSMTEFTIGDKVAVYYSGVILEIYPAIVKDVRAITLLEPADRTENERG